MNNEDVEATRIADKIDPTSSEPTPQPPFVSYVLTELQKCYPEPLPFLPDDGLPTSSSFGEYGTGACDDEGYEIAAYIVRRVIIAVQLGCAGDDDDLNGRREALMSAYLWMRYAIEHIRAVATGIVGLMNDEMKDALSPIPASVYDAIQDTDIFAAGTLGFPTLSANGLRQLVEDVTLRILATEFNPR